MISKNPFDALEKKLEGIENLLYDLKSNQQNNNLDRPQNERLTRKELCQRYKISLGTCHSLMRSGKLAFTKIGRKTLFETSEVEAYFIANRKRLSHD